MDMEESLQASNYDRFGGVSLFDMMEREALGRAQMNYNWSSQSMADASRYQPAIPPLREVAIDHGHMLGDILFDNVFSDFKVGTKPMGKTLLCLRHSLTLLPFCL